MYENIVAGKMDENEIWNIIEEMSAYKKLLMDKVYGNSVHGFFEGEQPSDEQIKEGQKLIERLDYKLNEIQKVLIDRQNTIVVILEEIEDALQME